MTKKSLFITIFLLIIFLASRIFFSSPGFLEKASSYILYPFLNLSSSISKPIKKIIKKKKSYAELIEDYQWLRKKYEKLLQETVKLKSLLKYAEKSTELREFKNRYNLNNAILSKILIKNITPDEHSFMLNRGSRNGVQKNMVAIYKFQLLGRVQQVFPTYCKVVLITDRHSKVAAHTNTGDSRGIVEGGNVINRCKLRYISHLKSIHNGDLVLSSGQGLIFPEGFCLGEIISVKTNDLCHNVELKPLVDFKSIEMCHLTSLSKMNLF